jgi:hypothetical protein
MRPWTLLASTVCALTTASCASPGPSLQGAPRLEMPTEARRPCELHRLPDTPSQADLEIGYAARGAEIVACDAARRLAVETHDGEHALEDEARRRK